MAKKKIREQFDAVYQNGDEQAIKKMLKSNPWLRDEMRNSMDADQAKSSSCGFRCYGGRAWRCGSDR